MKSISLSLVLLWGVAVMLVSGCNTSQPTVVRPVPTVIAEPATVPPATATITPTATPTFAPELVASEALLMQGEFAILLTSVAISPDSRRIAAVRAEPQRRRVLVNGVEQQAYDDIVGSLIFSKDSQRLAYFATQGGKQLLVLDGKEGPLYDFNLTNVPPVFSPDSQHIAYIALKGLKQLVNLDGQEGPAYDVILGLTFRPDSQGVAYWAKKDNHWVLVVNGQEKNTYDELDTFYATQSVVIGFSQDGQHVLYRIQQGTKHRLVVDGVEGPAFDEIAAPHFSPIGASVAYGGRRDNKWVIVLDNQESTSYDAVTPLVYSPDGKHQMYAGKTGNTWTVSQDGRAGNSFDAIQDLIYSPDSQHSAVLAQKDGKWLVVADGKEQRQYDEIIPHTLLYSPDSRHLAYAARQNGKLLIVLDGTEGASYLAVTPPAFSPDSQHVAYGAQAGTRQFMIVDGKEGEAFDTIGRPFFESPTTLHFLGGRDNRIYLVEETFASSADARAALQQTATAAADVNATLIARAFPTETARAAANATSQAQATQTQQAATTATALAKAQMAATAQAAPVVNPAQLNWNVILSDSFDKIANDWTAGSFAFDYGKVAKSIANGKYTWTIQATKPVVDRDLPHMVSVADMEVSVDVRHVSGAPSGAYGLVLRDNFSSYYLFMISDDQTYKFGQGRGSDISKELRSGKSTAIKPGAVNHLVVIAQGPYFTFFVNNQFLFKMDDDTFDKGVAGPAVALFNAGDSGAFEFDNFEVRIPGATAAQAAQMPLVLSDWSTGNPNQWPLGDYSDQNATGNRQLSGTVYRWSTTNAADVDLIAAPVMAPLSDLDLSVDARQVSGGKKVQYGLVFRCSEPNSEYLFTITGFGAYSLDYNNKGQFNVLVYPTTSPAVKPGEVNHLRVIAAGSHFTLYVNDQIVAQIDDRTLTQGTVGLTVNNYDTDNPQAVIEFSNFSVRGQK